MRDPNYKLRTELTKISRLNKPYGPSMRFVGEQPDTKRTHRRRRPAKPVRHPLLSYGSIDPSAQ
jgi:hypothetical protein